MDPPREDGRRCLYPDEMLALGWRPFTEEELAASTRDRKRAGFGVELWFDPARMEAGKRLRRAAGAQDATEGAM